MATLNHICGDCDSEFTIKYNEELCDDDPIYCPFCGAYLLLENDATQDDDD